MTTFGRGICPDSRDLLATADSLQVATTDLVDSKTSAHEPRSAYISPDLLTSTPEPK